jgi:hypothetical protein
VRPLLLVLLAGCSFRTNGATSGPDACSAISPTSCDDGIPCTDDSVEGAGCAAACVHTPITTAANGDGCCPAGATSDVDDDCSITCGNGTVEANETCDTAITSGDGACPTSCDDSMVCTSDTLVSAGTCNAACSNSTITQPMSGDGCCPSGATHATDTDCPLPPAAFRITELELRDPHPYLPGIGGCNDSITFSNGSIQRPIDHDDNNDGYFDDSQVIVFRPLAQGDAETTPASVYFGAQCTTSSTTCTPGALAAGSDTATSAAAGTCLATIAGTTKPYSPAVTAATGPCFSTGGITMTATIFGANVPLQQVQVGATYVGSPATGMMNGVLRAFLTKSDAEATSISLGIITARLASFLPGGQNNCASFSDMDMLGMTPGWWIYFNFTAESVPWTEP